MASDIEVTPATVVDAISEAALDAEYRPTFADAIVAAIVGMDDESRQEFLIGLTEGIVANGKVPVRKADGSGYAAFNVEADIPATPEILAAGTDTQHVLTVETAAWWSKRTTVVQATPTVINLDGTAASLNIDIAITAAGSIRFGAIASGLAGRRGSIRLTYAGTDIVPGAITIDSNGSGATVVIEDGVSILALSPYDLGYVIVDFTILADGPNGLVAIDRCRRYSPPFSIIAHAQSLSVPTLPAHLRTDTFLAFRGRNSESLDTPSGAWSFLDTAYTTGSPFSVEVAKAVAPADNGLSYPLTNGSSRHGYVQIRNARVIQGKIAGGSSGTSLVMPTLTGIKPTSRLIGGILTRAAQTDLTALMPVGWTELREVVSAPTCSLFVSPAPYGDDDFSHTGTFDTATSGYGAWIAEIGQ